MSLLSLVDDLLAEQQELTAVERFAALHSAGRAAATYQALLPASPPGPGQQYAFSVDLDACTGCKACVVACRSLNGLDADESWRSVGLLHGVQADGGVQQTVTTGCHHCVEPACLTGCPVDAYEKDPVTGIVAHLDDQCIGCSYCTLTCPYEVPRFNKARGIVRKCDMCQGRLAEGEAPACAQACPNEAIAITVVDVAAVRSTAGADGAVLVPGAPASAITVPTTQYRSTRSLDGLAASGADSVRRGQAHTPLAVMLVLTQLSVGVFVAGLLRNGASHDVVADHHSRVALLSGMVAMAASTLHLGRPGRAYRAVIGLRHSWLSREIVAFGAYAGLAALYALAPTPALGWTAAVAGMAGVGCSVLVYAVTGRRWWRGHWVAPKFALTAVVCGLAVVGSSPLLLVAAMVAKLAAEAAVLLPSRSRGGGDELARTALLLIGELRTAMLWRVAGAVAGGITVPVLTILIGVPPLLVVLGALAVVAGELVERCTFFTASAPPRMPS